MGGEARGEVGEGWGSTTRGLGTPRIWDFRKLWDV